VRTKLAQKLHAALERRFPERRLFLRSDTETRFIRLHPSTQLIAWTGTTLMVGWTITATAIVLMDSIGSGNFRAQAQRDQMIYEERLNSLSAERDLRAAEAAAAQERFSTALEQISTMQSELLASEDRRREMETGLEVVQAALRRTIQEREVARDAAEEARLALAEGGTLPGGADAASVEGTLDILSGALADTAEERDRIAEDAQLAFEQANEMQLELRLMTERNDEIFRQLEEAMTVSVEPLGEMFRAAGMDPDAMLRQVRKGYNGVGPLTPIQFSTMGAHADHGDYAAENADRANALLGKMDEINLYRIAASKAPFAQPVKDRFRFTSGFGQRWGRLHAGADFAAPIGTPVYSTADGVVVSAGWASGYGRLIKIQHEFGIETRYAHLNKIHVKVGQRVSRGERIGDMGNSGRSTGPHLHYEVRVGGTPVNPMTYIRAGKDVF